MQLFEPRVKVIHESYESQERCCVGEKTEVNVDGEEEASNVQDWTVTFIAHIHKLTAEQKACITLLNDNPPYKLSVFIETEMLF